MGKKLKLDELNVQSFTISNNRRILGGAEITVTACGNDCIGHTDPDICTDPDPIDATKPGCPTQFVCSEPEYCNETEIQCINNV